MDALHNSVIGAVLETLIDILEDNHSDSFRYFEAHFNSASLGVFSILTDIIPFARGIFSNILSEIVT